MSGDPCVVPGLRYIERRGSEALCQRRGALREQAITSADAEQAARLYESGMSISEIVEQIGYSYSTVRKSLHGSGVAMRPKGIKRSALE